jgi:hypothetical protein
MIALVFPLKIRVLCEEVRWVMLGHVKWEHNAFCTPERLHQVRLRRAYKLNTSSKVKVSLYLIKIVINTIHTSHIILEWQGGHLRLPCLRGHQSIGLPRYVSALSLILSTHESGGTDFCRMN